MNIYDIRFANPISEQGLTICDIRRFLILAFMGAGGVCAKSDCFPLTSLTAFHIVMEDYFDTIYGILRNQDYVYLS